jgi:hypothetical protein
MYILYFMTFTIPCPSKVSYKYKANYSFVLQVCLQKGKPHIQHQNANYVFTIGNGVQTKERQAHTNPRVDTHKPGTGERMGGCTHGQCKRTGGRDQIETSASPLQQWWQQQHQQQLQRQQQRGYK